MPSPEKPEIKILKTPEKPEKELENPEARGEKLAELRRFEEEERYYERVRMGEANAEEALAYNYRMLEEVSRDPKLLQKPLPFLTEHLFRAKKQEQKLKERSHNFPAQYEGKFDEFKSDNKQDLFLIVTNKKFQEHEADFAMFDKKFSEIMPNYIRLHREDQLRIAAQFGEASGSKADPELLRKIMVFKIKNIEDAEQMKKFVRDERAMEEYEKQVKRGADSEQAFEESLKKASPELQKSFQEYAEKWQSAAVADVFQTPTAVSDVPVELPSRDEVKKAVELYQQAGISLSVSPDSYVGVITGKDIFCEAAIFVIDGKPKLFIYDRNADTGIRGPIEPESAAEAIYEMSVDRYFSRKFREFSTFESEKDPTKVVDVKLCKIVRAFLPGAETLDLDIHVKRILDNLAHLCVTPDSQYVFIEDKVRVLERIAADSSKAEIAKKLLKERDFTKSSENLSLNLFEAGIK